MVQLPPADGVLRQVVAHGRRMWECARGRAHCNLPSQQPTPAESTNLSWHGAAQHQQNVSQFGGDKAGEAGEGVQEAKGPSKLFFMHKRNCTLPYHPV